MSESLYLLRIALRFHFRPYSVLVVIGSSFTLLLELLLLVVVVVVVVHAAEVKISDGVFDFAIVMVELVSANVDDFFEVDDEGDAPTRSARSSGNRRDDSNDMYIWSTAHIHIIFVDKINIYAMVLSEPILDTFCILRYSPSGDHMRDPSFQVARILMDHAHENANDALDFGLYSSTFATSTAVDTGNCLLDKNKIDESRLKLSSLNYSHS
uniref:Uncharacterized protein n=1 Tax=Glossina brevipalpis TaxID=37001 RepID=A0A1A9X2V1_9MUSC